MHLTRRMLGLALLALPLQALAVDVLVSNMVDAPDPALRGGTIVYSASVTNNTSDVAHTVVVTFTLDAQTTFVAVSDSACGYASGPHQVTCNYATLTGDVDGPGSAQVKDIDVTVRTKAGAGSTVAFAAAVSTTDTDGNSGNDTLEQITTIDDGADLSLVLSGSPSTVVASGNLTYTAILANAGPDAAATTTATITLSPHLSFDSASGTGWTCNAAGQVVSCKRSSAAVGALPDISIATRVTGNFIGTITSTGVVSVAGGASDVDNSNDSSTANTTVTNGTDLAITKTGSSATLSSNQAMSFVLAPRNLGAMAASTVTVSDSLPAGFTAISALGTGWSCVVNGLDVSCTRASYAAGAAADITISATAPTVLAKTDLVNSTTISATTQDGNSTNNIGSFHFSVLPDGVDLALTKSKTPNPVAQGNNLTSTMRVTNHGPRAAASGEVRVVDTLPAGESFVALASGTNWTCGAQVGQSVTCTYNAALAVGASSPNLVLSTNANGIGTLTNNACVVYTDANGVLSDPNSSNNCAGASSESTASPSAVDLQLTKVADLATLNWNAPTITYTLTVTNGGPGSATGIVVADPIPGYIPGNTVVSASMTGGTTSALFACTTGATVTCTQTSGAMANNSTAIFQVTVTRPMVDSSAEAGNVWTNHATVHSNVLGDPNPLNNSAQASVRVDPVTDITVLNTVTPTSALAGTNATYVLTVNNNGPSTAAGVTVSDVFTIGAGTMTFISATPSAGSCAAFNPGTGTLSCSLGTMASGATETVTVVVRPDYMSSPPSPRTISNTATVATTTPESNGTNNSAGSTLTVTQAALDILVNNTDNLDPLGFVPGGSPVFPDNVVTYRNVITNRGPSVASGLTLSYTMRPPTGKSITFLGDKLAATGQLYANYCNNLGVQVTGPATQTISCAFPAGMILAAGNASTELYLDFRVDTQPNSGGDAYQSTVTVAAREPESVSANNAVNQTTTIKMRADLQLSKAARAFIGGVDAAAATIDFRQPFYWVVTLTNAGPGDSNATSVTDTLPAGLVLYTGGASAPYNAAPYNSGVLWSTNNGTPTNGSCTGSSTISCTIGLLERNKVATIRIPVVASTYSASLTNCASATTSDVDINPANNTNVCSAAVTMQRSSIAGFVYADSNNDAAKAAGEPGIASVALRLDGTDIYGNAVTNLAATSDSNGAFSFTNRTPGTYTITETQPLTHLDGTETAGTSGGTATGPGADTISAIALPANTAATGYLFGELLPAALSGFVFMDLDTDAVRDVTGIPATDESAGVTGVSITLTGADDLGPVNTSANSSVNGAYNFANLRPGSYQLVEATLGGLTHTGMTIGSKGGNDGASAHTAGQAVPGLAKRTISAIPVAAGDAAANYNFGESGQGLGGLVYADLNNNGVKDAGEPGIAGVTVALSGLTSAGADICTVLSPNPCSIATDSNGAYGFVGLPASNASGYTLTEQAQASAPLSNYVDGIDTLGTVNGLATGAKTNDQFTGIVIGTSQIGSNYNFGEIAASLAGKVYLDVDRSNTFGAGDTALTGVGVTLSGLTASGANVCTVMASCAASTDASGNFSFTGLPASNASGYTLTQTQPVDYVDAANTVGTGPTTPGSASVAAGNSLFSGTVLAAGQSGVNYLFGEKTGSLTGYVYIDHNNDGVKDVGDTGIAGVTLTMTGSAAGGGTACGGATCVATSAADGAYSFATLRNADAGGYTVTETQPAAYLDGKVSKGTAGGVSCAACVDSTPNIISSIAFNAASAYAAFNFGELQGTSISGNVYVDGDLDASFDAGEALPGVTVTLTGTDDLGNAVNMTRVTAADGSYSFAALRPSTAAGYTVTETHPIGYSEFAGASGTQPGVVDGAPAGTAALNTISDLVMVAGGLATGHNFREQGASISGTVYLDSNSNGVRDGSETGIAAVTVQLNGPLTRSMQTNATGQFAFTGLVAGTYSLIETQPGAYADGVDLPGSAGGVAGTPKNSIVGIVLATAADASSYLFGEKPSPARGGSLAGTVYADTNKDGVRDSGDVLLPGVTLTLAGSGDNGIRLERSVQTDAGGGYLFSEVIAGKYTLTETQPAAFGDFDGASGTAVGTGAGGTAGLNTVTGIVMPASGAALGYDFREQLAAGAASLRGAVYMDDNNNGARDAGEAPLPGVHLTLSGRLADGSDACANTSCVAVTDAGGNYAFEGVGAGRYQLVETQTDLDTARIVDGKETAGTAGGTVDNGGFGTAASQNTIGTIEVTEALLASSQGRIDGYLFGERLRGGPTLKPPLVSGYVWFDRKHTRVRPSDEQHEGAQDWTVTLSQNGTLICTAKSAANGFYQFDNLHCPGYEESGLPTGSGFAIRFSKEGNNLPNVASSGGGAGEASGGTIRNITLRQGDDVSEQNLPLDPSGVVYDSTTRQPIAGAVVTFSGPPGFEPARHMLGGIPALTQTTGSDGLYQFFLQNDFPNGVYRLVVSTYPAGYLPAESVKIPACAGTPHVGPVPDPALVQKTDTAPGLSVPLHNSAACVGMVAGGATSTQYYFSFTITHDSAPILNNHIPLDPAEAAGLALSKTGDKQQIEFGETLGYTVTVKQTAGTGVAQLSVRDSLPAGFSLVKGTVKVNGKAAADPAPSAGALLVFNLGPLASKEQAVLTYRLRAGVGSLQGDGVNRAIAYACNTASGCVAPATGQALPNAYASNTGLYKVRLTAGVFTEQACVAGKVFVDCNTNHVQDSEELGVPGVRLYLEDGTSFTTDVEGKYSYCGLSPKSHVVKADSLTLPRGSRLTTTSNRNLGDAQSIWLDAKNGELLRADFAEGSCAAPVIEQVKARRSQGGVRSVETEAARLPGLKFDSKAPDAPRQATDSANQDLVKPRQGTLPSGAGESHAQ